MPGPANQELCRGEGQAGGSEVSTEREREKKEVTKREKKIHRFTDLAQSGESIFCGKGVKGGTMRIVDRRGRDLIINLQV